MLSKIIDIRILGVVAFELIWKADKFYGLYPSIFRKRPLSNIYNGALYIPIIYVFVKFFCNSHMELISYRWFGHGAGKSQARPCCIWHASLFRSWFVPQCSCSQEKFLIVIPYKVNSKELLQVFVRSTFNEYVYTDNMHIIFSYLIILWWAHLVLVLLLLQTCYVI